MKSPNPVINLGSCKITGRAVSFIHHLPQRYVRRNIVEGTETILVGRTFRGEMHDVDGNYIAIRCSGKDSYHIDRDMFGSIPLYYSLNKRVITTDMRALVPGRFDQLNLGGVSEYIACAFTSLGRTIYDDVSILRPDETISVVDGTIKVAKKAAYFSPEIIEGNLEELLESALEKSILNLAQEAGERLILNLSGGNDSTLILALLKKVAKDLAIHSTTFFHSDWREDFNDWHYAEIASKKYGTQHSLVTIENEAFEQAHRNLLSSAQNVFHTYAVAFFMQNLAMDKVDADAPIVNGSGPDETMIGTEKIPVADLLSMNQLSRKEWIEYALNARDYIKIPESEAAYLINQGGEGFLDQRLQLAEELIKSENFVEFQRRFHSMLILQDHICELSQVAAVVGRPIFFPFLTNDMFTIIFGRSFNDLNKGAVYKSAVKNILLKYMDAPFVYRHKIGFQSPSRNYFMSKAGFGREMQELLYRNRSKVLDLPKVRDAVSTRLSDEFSTTKRYDFVEWAVFNMLRLEALIERR